MRCARVRDSFDELFDGRLGQEERRQAEQHLSACSQCAAEYETMRRILMGIRKIPRPRAPVLEVSPPPGTAPFVRQPRPARRWLLRAAAAVLLCIVLGLSHALAYYLGDRKQRDLAEIGRRALPRLLANHLDDASSQVQFARQVAKDDPTAVTRLVFDDELARKHRAMSRALLRVADQPGLRPWRAQFANIVRGEDEVYSSRRPETISEKLARLEERLERLQREMEVIPAAEAPSPRKSDDEEFLVRQNWRLLRGGQAEAVARRLAGFVNRHPHARFGNVHLWVLAQSSLELGEIPDMATVQFLLRREGDRGFESFFNPWIRRVKSGGGPSSPKMISIGLGGDPLGPLIQIQGSGQGGGPVRFHLGVKAFGPGQPVDGIGFLNLDRILTIPKRD